MFRGRAFYTGASDCTRLFRGSPRYCAAHATNLSLDELVEGHCVDKHPQELCVGARACGIVALTLLQPVGRHKGSGNSGRGGGGGGESWQQWVQRGR